MTGGKGQARQQADRLPTLRQLLQRLAMGSVVPMALLALALIGYQYQRERALLQADAIGTTRALLAVVDDRLLASRPGEPAAAGAALVASLREMLARQQLPPTWIAAVLDRSGAIVARTHDHERQAGTRARPALLARIAEVPEDVVESVTVDGIPVLTAFSRSTQSGWSVVIGIPRGELNAPLLRSALALLVGTSVVLLLTLWLAWRLAASLGASVEALGGAVRATGHRARLELPAPAFQEARQLGLAFAHAHAALEDANAALAHSDSRMRAILQTATDAIVTADDAGRIIVFNPAAEEMFGIDAEDALGQPVESLVPAPLREQHRALRLRAGEGRPRRMAPGRVVQGLRGDGTTFMAEASISVADDGEGRLYTVILREVPRA